ncbi:MAG TPA: DNA polymerase III subunit chi [Caulobacteraceae bacterium]|nr:DNA polymerase III subunit chi [Caulobacteraceae bacterium]
MAKKGCEIWFYHLERTALEQALPDLLEKTLARGWKALVRTGDPARLEQLDEWLWTWRDDSFLPHGLAGEVHAAREPVLLSAAADNVNAADALFLIHRAETPDLEGYQRCVVLFDGRDESALKEARKQWQAVKAKGHAVSYWQESPERGWVKQA